MVHSTGEWVEMTRDELRAFMLEAVHAQAIIENRMTPRQRKDEWMRVRYWEEYIKAGAPKDFQWPLEEPVL